AEVERQRDRAQAMASQFADLFDEANPRDTDSGDVSAITLLERSIKRLETEASQPALTRAALLVASANALGALGRAQEREKVARFALQLAGKLEPPDLELLAAAYAELAGALSQSNPRQALLEADAGLALFDDK